MFETASAVPYGSRLNTCQRKCGTEKTSQPAAAATTAPRRRLKAASASTTPERDEERAHVGHEMLVEGTEHVDPAVGAGREVVVERLRGRAAPRARSGPAARRARGAGSGSPPGCGSGGRRCSSQSLLGRGLLHEAVGLEQPQGGVRPCVQVAVLGKAAGRPPEERVEHAVVDDRRRAGPRRAPPRPRRSTPARSASSRRRASVCSCPRRTIRSWKRSRSSGKLSPSRITIRSTSWSRPISRKAIRPRVADLLARVACHGRGQRATRARPPPGRDGPRPPRAGPPCSRSACRARRAWARGRPPRSISPTDVARKPRRPKSSTAASRMRSRVGAGRSVIK